MVICYKYVIENFRSIWSFHHYAFQLNALAGAAAVAAVDAAGVTSDTPLVGAGAAAPAGA